MTPDEISYQLTLIDYPTINKVLDKILNLQQSFYISYCKEKGVCVYLWVTTKYGKKYYFCYHENDKFNNNFALQNPQKFIKHRSLYFARFLVLFSSFWDYDPIVSFHFCENQQDAYYCELMQRFQLGIKGRNLHFGRFLFENMPVDIFTMNLKEFQFFCRKNDLDSETLLHSETIKQLKIIYSETNQQ